MKSISRRAALSHAAKLGAATALPKSVKLLHTPGPIAAHKLLVGDLILGPVGSVVRLAQVHRLPTGRIRIRYTQPVIDSDKVEPMGAVDDSLGYGPHKPFYVLARGVKEAAAQPVHSEPAVPVPAPKVIDGGSP